MYSPFLSLEDVGAVIHHSTKTLRNHLNSTSGDIKLGAALAPIPTILIGSRRLVQRQAFEAWLQRVAGVGLADAPAASNSTEVTLPEPQPAKRGRGRPRQSTVTRAGV